MIFPRETMLLGNGCIQLRREAKRVRYRTLNFNGERWGAHRLSYHLNKSELPRKPPAPDQGLVLHHCDNKHCINPDHLYLGTGLDNAKDFVARSESWKEFVKRQKGKVVSDSTKAKISDAQRRHQKSLSVDDRRKRMAPAQAKANPKAQTPEAKAKRVASMRKYWESLGPEGRRKHVRPALKARGI